MTTSQADRLTALITPDKRFAVYGLDDYITYCREIRNCVKERHETKLDSKLVDFFEQKFVQEMEVLAKIADRFCRGDGETKVQYIEHDPPDGKLFFPDGQEVGLECTSSRNDRLIKFAIEQNRRGIPTSTTGHTVDDIQGTRRRGYVMAGHGVDTEEDICTHQKTANLISERIQGKISKLRDAQWLSVFIDEYELPTSAPQMQQLLESTLVPFTASLVSRGISDLFFVGNTWLSRHSLL